MAEGTWGGTLDKSIFKVTLTLLINNQRIQTGFHLRDLAVNDNTPEDVSEPVLAWVNDHFRANMLVGDAFVSVDILQLGTEFGFTHTYTNTFGTANVTGGNILPTFLAVKIAMKRQARKRYGQGRMFWPLRAESLADGDVLNSTGVTQYQSVVDALVDSFNPAVLTHDLALVNVHGIIPPKAATGSSPARAEIPAKWYDVDAVVLSTALTTLRSRKIGVGT